MFNPEAQFMVMYVAGAVFTIGVSFACFYLGTRYWSLRDQKRGSGISHADWVALAIQVAATGRRVYWKAHSADDLRHKAALGPLPGPRPPLLPTKPPDPGDVSGGPDDTESITFEQLEEVGSRVAEYTKDPAQGIAFRLWAVKKLDKESAASLVEDMIKGDFSKVEKWSAMQIPEARQTIFDAVDEGAPSS